MARATISFGTYLVLALVALSVPIVAQTSDEKRELFNTLIVDEDALLENIRSKCEDEWTTDFQMQKYCQDEQRKGYTKLAEIWTDAVTNIRVTAVQCVLDWSDDLLFDWTMIHYCTDQQVTAWKALQ